MDSSLADKINDVPKTEYLILVLQLKHDIEPVKGHDGTIRVQAVPVGPPQPVHWLTRVFDFFEKSSTPNSFPTGYFVFSGAG